MNVGELCAQIAKFVVANTSEKRAILEQVPQSKINEMTSKERKVHRENVKKQLEGLFFFLLFF